MKNIVIVGAGFGGLQLALKLEKKFRNDKNIELTLLDKRAYHIFAANLYEAATTEEEVVSAEQVKGSISLPIYTILKNKRIKFVQGEVSLIDPAKKQLSLTNKKISYDYLALALGSQSDYFNIEGSQQNSLPLKSLSDAMRIRSEVVTAIQLHRTDVNKKNIRLVVAGGGYTGLEFAAKLKDLVDFLAWENQYPREKIEIEVIEAANKVIAGFDDRLSQDALERMQELEVHVRLSSRITKVDRNFIELLTGDKISYDLLFWTTGVKAVNIKMEGVAPALDPKGRFTVNDYFQMQNHDNIFALGDIACVMGGGSRPAPSTAQDAIDQARYLAHALPYIMKNQKPPKPYQTNKHGFIVALGGHWAILDYAGFYFKGFFASVVHKLSHLRYYWSIVPLWTAIKWVLFEAEMYSRND